MTNDLILGLQEIDKQNQPVWDMLFVTIKEDSKDAFFFQNTVTSNTCLCENSTDSKTFNIGDNITIQIKPSNMKPLNGIITCIQDRQLRVK